MKVMRATQTATATTIPDTVPLGSRPSEAAGVVEAAGLVDAGLVEAGLVALVAPGSVVFDESDVRLAFSNGEFDEGGGPVGRTKELVRVSSLIPLAPALVLV